MRRDLADRLLPSDGPFEERQSIWYWDKDPPQHRIGQCKGARVMSAARPPMITIELAGGTFRVNQAMA
eukprot:12894835-Prorocentrum_lima.AAC.1